MSTGVEKILGDLWSASVTCNQCGWVCVRARACVFITLFYVYIQDGVTSFIEKECVWSKFNMSIQRESQFVDSYGEFKPTLYEQFN